MVGGTGSGRWIAGIAGLFGLAAVLVMVGVVLKARGVQHAVNIAGLVSIPLAVAPLVVGLVVWLRRQPPVVAAAGTEQLGRARQLLADQVRTQWRAEERIRALGDPEPMPVQWRLTQRPVTDHARLVAPDGMVLAGRSDRIGELVEQFSALSRQRLVVLGGPGSGKTTLAVQLVLSLLDTRADADPVPVLLTLAGWNLDTHPRLQDWIAARLGEDYPALRALGPAVPQSLVDQSMVMPVLDGLDELPEGYRPQVIVALNGSLGASDPVVLTSRTDDFAAAVMAGDVLTAAAVIESEPLTATDAADYLTSCLPPDPGQPWAVVLQALRHDAAGPLAAVCATPLGLWLLRTVYITTRRDPRPLISDSKRYPDAAAVEDHLLKDLIPAVVKARPPGDSTDLLRPRHCWDAADVRRWLSYLAQHQQGDRDLRWWHLARRTLKPRRAGLLVGLTVSLMAGLMYGLVYGLVEGWASGLVGMLVFGLGSALFFGPVLGLVTGRVIVSGFVGEPGYANFHLRGRRAILAHSIKTNFLRVLRGGMLLGLVPGAVFGLVLGLIPDSPDQPDQELGLVSGLVSGLMVGVMVALPVGLAVGLVKWTGVRSTTDRAGTPTSTYRGDRALFILQSGLSALVGALVGGLMFGLFFGLMFGLASGLVAGASRPWLCFAVAACWLAIIRHLPWRLLVFLDDAYRLGLLRIAGPAYQFRHAKLQDHLTKQTD